MDNSGLVNKNKNHAYSSGKWNSTAVNYKQKHVITIGKYNSSVEP